MLLCFSPTLLHMKNEKLQDSAAWEKGVEKKAKREEGREGREI